MVKRILLNVDEKMFYKMKAHKSDTEENLGESLTWEEYIKYLFGLRK